MELIRSAWGLSVRGGDSIGSDLSLRQIIGIGRNYAEHAKEQGAAVPERPMLFSKNQHAATLPDSDIIIPKICQDRPQVDFEGELAVILSRGARDVSEEEALEYALGLCCANDVSARWWQKEGSGGQFFRGKSFDTFCPLGPEVTPPEEIEDVQSLSIRTTVNGEVMQDGSTSQMIFPVRALISELSKGMTLAPGTVILTGTPSGVGMSRDPQRFLEDGDVVVVEIEGLGRLENRVRLE